MEGKLLSWNLAKANGIQKSGVKSHNSSVVTTYEEN